MSSPRSRTLLLRLGLPSVALFFGGVLLFGQAPGRAADAERIVGEPWRGERGISKTTAEIMASPNATKRRAHTYLKREFEIPGREDRSQDPSAPAETSWPKRSMRVGAAASSAAAAAESNFSLPQTVGTSFNGVLGPQETEAFPPDTMGAVGPSQFFIFVNGRLRTFNKTTGLRDNVVEAEADWFFSSVMTHAGLNFTSDPQI